ncbi:MAG: asparaginase [Balneolaceae bacterium]|nr:asparaginase [Balneolaceae bacterium]
MKKILLLQTGGTIAMKLNPNGPELDAESWAGLLQDEIPELSEIANLEAEKVFFEDSSDVNLHHWKQLSETIKKNYQHYDGFVILHGTDTMSYTASALSFALSNVGKPIIFTGSQVPLSKIRSDARRNLVNAVELATHPIPEIAICFNDHLYRGNRSTKMSIGDFDAFASPNYPLLAEIGLDISLSKSAMMPPAKGDLKCNPKFDDAIHIVKVHPGLRPDYLKSIPLNSIKAVIFEAFGSGNMPMKGEQSLLPFIETCRQNGCHVIITSQAAYDSVDLNQYASGREASKLGALSAGEMTMEATVTKTMHLLAQNLDEASFRTEFLRSVAGER